LSNENYARMWKQPSATVYGTDYDLIPTARDKKPSDHDVSYGTSISVMHNHTNKLPVAYNIAFFDWVEYADENEVKDAEAKLWKALNGFKNMRRRLPDGTYTTDRVLAISVCEAIAKSLCAFISSTTNPYQQEIRIVGHSLGGQAAINVAKIVGDFHGQSQYLKCPKPSRVELCDPFWSNGAKAYLTVEPRWTGERCTWYAQQLAGKGVAIGHYRTSPISTSPFVGDANLGLNSYAALHNVCFWWTLDVVVKHKAALEWYLWSICHGQTVECTINICNTRKATGEQAGSAACPTWRLFRMAEQSNHWVQVEGRYNKNPTECWFQRKAGMNGDLI